MEKIYYKKKLLGIYYHNFAIGTNPITQDNEPLQVIALKHKKGKTIAPHLHAGCQKKIFKTQSCFIVKHGHIKIDVYNSRKKYIRSLMLKKGDLFVSLEGGHGISCLSDAEIIEIKNGPFEEDKIAIEE